MKGARGVRGACVGTRVGCDPRTAWGAWGAWGGSLDPPHTPHALRTTPAAALEAVAERVGRLSPSHRDPERFHMDKAELVGELRRLARTLGRGAA